MTRPLRIAGVLALLLAVVAPGGLARLGAPASAAPVTCAGGGVVSGIGGGWLAITPKFPIGPQEVSLVATPGFAADVIYVSNGQAVLRSRDAGATWTTVYKVSASLLGGTPSISALLAPSSANNSSYLYVGVTTSLLAGLTSPSVAVSTRQGDAGSWTTPNSQAALPPLGSIVGLAASSQLPSSAYAVVRVNTVVASHEEIYATSDAGVSWATRTPPGGAFTGTQLVAHPTRQVELFALDAQRVVHSLDGGATFTSTNLSAAVSSYSAAPGGGGVRLAAARADQSSYARSDDGGATWTSHATPVDVSDIAMAPLQDLVGFSAGTDFYLEGRGTGQLRRSPVGGAPSQLAISAPTKGGLAVTGLRMGVLLRLTVGLDLTAIPPVCGPGGLTPVRLHATGTKQFASLLTPAQLHVSLPAGGRQVVPYRLLVPRTPTPLDAMFLVDTTGSMGGTIDGLRRDLAAIVTALDAAGLDAQFGLGDFQDYPWNGNGDHAYQLDRRIGPADESLRAALNNLTLGDGGDGPEAPLTALLQSTTGEGDFSVRPGQEAGYRPPALKLAFVATDSQYHRHGDKDWNTDNQGRSVSWPGPYWEDVINALNKAGVHQVGLSVASDATRDMTEAAAETSTFAPPGGVDCNGDGRVDVPGQAPLVCDISSLVSVPVGIGGAPDPGSTASGVGITAAVVALANGIPDLQPVSLRVASGARFARIATGPATRVLNLKTDNDLGYGLELRCPLSPPARHLIALSAGTPVRALASADVVLDCGGPGAPPQLVDGSPVAAVAVAPAAAPAAAQPVPNPNPQPNPNPNPQPNPNPNVNAGMVEQSQEEAQLALAVGDLQAMDPTEELAMSAPASRTESDIGFVAAAALLLTVSFAVAARTRARGQTCSAPH